MGWARLAVAVVARGVLFSILGMLTWALLPTVLGWTPTTVMTGSMEPRIHPGDVVVSRPVQADATALDHILLADDPDHQGKLRLHRLVDFAPDGNLILRGDANSANDSTPVAPAAVHGVAVLRVPFVGLPMVWFAEKNWGPFAAALAAVAALTLAAASGSGAPPSAGLRWRPKARRARTARTIVVLAAIPVLFCPELIMSTPAHARFSATAPTLLASSFSALGSYPCLSDLPPDSPYLFYRFNEGIGTTAANASGAAGNGTLQGTTTWVSGSCSANDSPALTLGGSAGSAGYVSTPQSVPSLNAFTVEIWFKTPDGSNTGGKLIGFGDKQTGTSTISDRHLFMTTDGRIAFGAAAAPGGSSNFKATTITSPQGTRYNDGQWHMATATMSEGTGLALYVDGSPKIADPAATRSPTYTGFWRVGNDNINSTTWTWNGVSGNPIFAGTVDNAAVYPSALTSAQVLTHFNAGR